MKMCLQTTKKKAADTDYTFQIRLNDFYFNDANAVQCWNNSLYLSVIYWWQFNFIEHSLS